ncbi:hypothetical protein Acy02nite_91550 [Actinoplanes cyaneus]|uniref:Uncharacterized protein n=1 Tax=Actinoplanes cyaneus TaxID=52696 RepID=A0A919IT75_9ACTN|nr:hypothetical protein Acy02nite_91550 [Actinoplanes cyaneus]
MVEIHRPRRDPSRSATARVRTVPAASTACWPPRHLRPRFAEACLAGRGEPLKDQSKVDAGGIQDCESWM